jgi:hypothetical protein
MRLGTSEHQLYCQGHPFEDADGTPRCSAQLWWTGRSKGWFKVRGWLVKLQW